MSVVDCAVIFDVDGPLLELTRAEEDAFFDAFRQRHGITGLSRDWNSYRIRNDHEITREILQRHFGRDPGESEIAEIKSRYFSLLRDGYYGGQFGAAAVPGAAGLVERLAALDTVALGIATANFEEAARLRLEEVGLWDALKTHAGCAEAGGAKHRILGQVISRLDVPPERIIFLGDNLNDLEASRENGVHFIGFHPIAAGRDRLARAGAVHVVGDHDASWELIRKVLKLSS